ncbi:hypothetical protein CWS72_14165 [Telmatospirillum siberiense]|uniref:Uncharacterized protein n=1 Tax=Telmatospirillum siberiense TaxID=382514 RepID=A0A2N3PUD8_9PROT|nr:hypothetical protein CWS72_14165 [Telmatospirillum siberiense]
MAHGVIEALQPVFPVQDGEVGGEDGDDADECPISQIMLGNAHRPSLDIFVGMSVDYGKNRWFLSLRLLMVPFGRQAKGRRYFHWRQQRSFFLCKAIGKIPLRNFLIKSAMNSAFFLQKKKAFSFSISQGQIKNSFIYFPRGPDKREKRSATADIPDNRQPFRSAI